MSIIERNITDHLEAALNTFRVVALGGARQTGKTTLVRDLLDVSGGTRVTLDDPSARALASDDPVTFLAGLRRPAMIDEFQRGGEQLLLAVKEAVDHSSARGQFLLTGSANYLSDRSVSETLAGRVGRLRLWPLSIGERRGVRETFVDHAFEPPSWPAPALEPVDRDTVVALILGGGFPEVVTAGFDTRQRRTWFLSYVLDVVSREALRPMAEIRHERELRSVLGLLAARIAQELVISDLANDSGLGRDTTAGFVALLEALYLVTLVPGWETSATTRAKRRAKVALLDTGLAAALANASASTFEPGNDGVLAGSLFENLVVAELHKQIQWSERSINVLHFRDRNGIEADVILEDWTTQQVVALEVKLTRTPLPKHVRHLATLRDRLGDRFRSGFLIHAGTEHIPLGERIWALPVSGLWRSDPL